MKAAVLLSGCGYLDGAEIREAVLSLLYLDQHGATTTCFSLDSPQHHVINHRYGDTQEEARDIMAEAARISRGNIHPMASLNSHDFDMLVIPGGYGVAKNFSNLAFAGANAQVEPEFQKVVGSFFTAKKPIVAICIAPAVLAVALKHKGLTLTIGEDKATAGIIESLGHTHQVCDSDAICIDAVNRVISCSAYMREDKLSAIASGIEKAIAHAVNMVTSNQSKVA